MVILAFATGPFALLAQTNDSLQEISPTPKLRKMKTSPAPAPATLRITDKVSHRLPREVFGQFLERPSWGGEYGPESVCDAQGRFSTAIEQGLAGMHAPIVRFPVGTDGDYIDWQDMAGLTDRPERPMTTGHKGDKVANRFGFP